MSRHARGERAAASDDVAVITDTLKHGRKAHGHPHQGNLAVRPVSRVGRDLHRQAEELLRTWLLGQRSLLAAALDHLGIEHNQGLTESDDVERFEKLSAGDVKKLVSHLNTIAKADDVAVYLTYMGTPHVQLG